MGCNNSKGLPMNIDGKCGKVFQTTVLRISCWCWSTLATGPKCLTNFILSFVSAGSATEAPDGAAKKETASQITESKLEIAMKTKRRAQNVFAEHIDLSGSFQSARFPKSPYVKGTIRQALMSNFVFSTLTPSEMEEFVDYMKQEKFEGGSDVIKQGEPGDYFYVVESGSFTYFVDGKPVGKAHPGNSFGELALMYNSPRAATVRADSDSVVWSLNRMTFRTILANATNNDSQKVKNSLRKVELLKDLEDAQLESLAGAVQVSTKFLRREGGGCDGGVVGISKLLTNKFLYEIYIPNNGKKTRQP